MADPATTSVQYLGLDGVWYPLAEKPWGSDDDFHLPVETPSWTPYRPERCTCASRELFANGCTCGFIVKKSWDEKLFEIDRKKRENP